MAITKTGQQYSDATPYKLNGFRYLMRYHAGVCEKIFSKYPKSKHIIYDSPIIALQEPNKKGGVFHICENTSK